MLIPKALVTITLKRIVGLDATLISTANRPYALAHIGGRLFGRSRLIPHSGGDFDLSREPIPWTNRIAADGSDIPVSIEIWDDRGDPAPARLVHIDGVVPLPYLTLEMTIGAGPTTAVLDVTGEIVSAPASTASVPRVPPDLSTRATLRPSTALFVELTDVLGLYAPIATGKPGLQRSARQPGYTSDDHLGRVFLNHDLSKAWKNNSQQIQLEARVTGPIPPNAKLHWHILDVDDPSDDFPEVHRQWGAYLDPNDYDHSGTPKGASANDNEGEPSHDPPWSEVTGFSLASKTKTDAKTAIVGNQSKILLNCPSTAGDNFIVTAEVEAKTHIKSFGARTGVITMWHRIQIESLRMSGGFVLPADEVAVPFEPACVELEAASERTVPDRQFMAPNEAAIDGESTAYVDTVFSHKGDSGWFAIISAMEPYALPTLKGEKAFEGTLTLQSSGVGSKHFEYIEIPDAHPDADFVQLGAGAAAVGFSLWSVQVQTTPTGVTTRCWIEEHDACPDFTHGNGSIAHATANAYSYSPRFRKKGSTVTPGGYGLPNDVPATVFKPGAFYVAGISPTVRRGRDEFFAGRTMIFTHHGAYRDAGTGLPRPGYEERVLKVIVHELIHAFGMPHKCGYFDLRTPRQNTCCMNYSPNWMVDDKRNLLPGTSNKVGVNMCGRHLKEIRRVRLQDNPGLAWK